MRLLGVVRKALQGIRSCSMSQVEFFFQPGSACLSLASMTHDDFLLASANGLQSEDPGPKMLSRRSCLQGTLAGLALHALCPSPAIFSAQATGFELKYCLASSMFGQLPLKTILPEVGRTGATSLDLWPKQHGSQREEAQAMGWESFEELMHQHGVGVGCLTRYDLGPFGLDEECAIAGRLQCPLIVTGGHGPVGLKGGDLKQAVKDFVERLKPHLEVAQRHGVRLAIENHGHNLIDHPDSLRWLGEMSQGLGLGVALAPYHLENLGMGAQEMASLILDLDKSLAMFYAWQHGMGCMKPLPKEQELLQLPGRGDLDFKPLMHALRTIDFKGWTEVFMHPVPRGIPIMPEVEEATREINLARSYLARCLNPIQ